MGPILLTEASGGENQDRGLIFHDGPRLVLCVADGAGGRSGGAEAAAMVIEMVRQQAYRLIEAKACADLLGKIDAAIAQDASAGETTCVLVVTTPTEIFGASVGDSGAWLIPTQGEHLNLTYGQQRKPFLGNGVARPHPFQQHGLRGHLLLATDGLLKYTAAETITTICRTTDGKAPAEQLINAVRYPSGALPDDVTVVLTKI